jgi:phenylpropionate dioxygenase-like ring-hydroxylating dioxygenase large terminal subunit
MPRHFAVEDRELDGMLERAIVTTFNEDRGMLEAQQEVLEERSLDTRALLTDADAGPSRARSIIARLLREENAERGGAHLVAPIREPASQHR